MYRGLTLAASGLLVAMMIYSCSELMKLPVRDYLQDSRINSSVRSALAAEQSIAGARLDVDTRDPVVHLHGGVASEEQKALAWGYRAHS
jgi:osmotically-inducible protein OsmY